jgi:hypothetical protein
MCVLYGQELSVDSFHLRRGQRSPMIKAEDGISTQTFPFSVLWFGDYENTYLP